MRRIAAGAAVVLGALVAIVGWSAGTASAHAVLEEVTPADDAVVDTAPAEVVLRFSETVSLSGGNARLLDDSGAEVGGEPEVVDTSVIIPIETTLADGTYVVSWTIVSADSHPISGTSVFHVGAPSADADDLRQGAEQGVGGGWLLRLFSNAVTTMLYAAALVSVGAWWFGRTMARGDDPDDTSHLLTPLVARSAALGIAVAVLCLPLRIARLGGGFESLSDGTFVEDAFRGPLGAAFAVTVIGFVLLLAGLGRSVPVTALGTVVVLAGFVVEGHTRTKDPRWAMVALDWVHLAAGAAWVGGLVALAIVLRTQPVAARRAVAVSRFSSLALWWVAVLAAAGIGLGLLILPDLSALFDTGYGLALVTKVVLVAVVVAIGAFNRWGLVPRIAATDGGEPAAASRLSRTLRAELVLLVIVLATTSVLVSRSPDASVRAGGDEPVPVTVDIALGEGAGTVSAVVTPATTGQNQMTMTLADPSGDPLAVFEPPVVEVREPARGLGPIEGEVHPLIDGGYHVFVDLPFTGTWELSVRARLDEFTSVSGSATFAVTE